MEVVQQREMEVVQQHTCRRLSYTDVCVCVYRGGGGGGGGVRVRAQGNLKLNSIIG